jgi:hypothetical protein
MSRYFDIRATVLIVVGHGILPEEEDRPTAYELKRLIVDRTQGAQDRSAVVLTDIWALNQEMAEFFPTIAVGGPSVNALTAQIYEELPVAFTRDQELFIQMDADSGKRAAVWGMDQAKTREAVEIFARDGFLDRFLDLVWGRAGE